MSTSTNGQICFGVAFEEGYKFPWSESNFDEWWLVESGWKWEGEKPFTESGMYAPGFTFDDPRIDAYFDSQRAWARMYPASVIEINYQSGECPAYILAVPSTVITASRGYPQILDSDSFLLDSRDETALLDFCSKYKLEFVGSPEWYLSSYWG